ncbi:hypothetical protein [Streptomyces gibsoniae]|uniref:Uncharacterized protein n=1 Tax=Streptomyces gibsoniae TaxID=3075529 RepID=A0ABU2U1M3_9ACTN|nr:hypothetical protein [Streptomyces sp. DSM 41699]MDT0467117.1 hypothetical protein [Streptomyces sp. DSM 41699]
MLAEGDYSEVLTSRDKRRYYCLDCGNVLTVYTKRAPELVPVHYRWGGAAAVKCGASRRSKELESAP